MRDDVEVQERLAEERELRRRPQAVRAGALAHVEQQAADLQLRERRVLARRHELHDLVAQRVLVERVHPFAEIDDDVRRFVAASLRRRHHQLEQPLLRPCREVPDHVEIDERDLLVVGEEDVARMRIGVEEAVDDDLVQVRAHELEAKAIDLDVEPRQRTERRDLRAEDVVHRQDRGRRVVGDRLRNDDVREPGEIASDDAQVLGLAQVGELARIVRRNSATSSTKLQRAFGPVWRSANAATSASASRSFVTCSRASGRCTLTATMRPSRSAARCTWPSDAVAIGSDSNIVNSFDNRAPSSESTIRSTSANENGAAGEQLSELDEGRPEPLEIVGDRGGFFGPRIAERGAMFQQQFRDGGIAAQRRRQMHGVSTAVWRCNSRTASQCVKPYIR